MKKILLISFLCFAISCTHSKRDKLDQEEDKESYLKQEYWQDGKAEVNVYELKQNRYNNIHPGSWVNIFVREDFLKDKQVKNETYTNDNSAKILKNIRLKKFTTGIYDYSIQTSVFTPLQYGSIPTLKVSSTSQEWCGTTFRQLNYKENKYQLEVRSYFEKEGDQTIELDKAILEDELLNLIRMSPELLPKGKFNMISSLSFLGLKHDKPKVVSAVAKLSEYKGEQIDSTKQLLAFQYSIPSQDRDVTYLFEKEIPHRIVKYLEAYPSAFDNQIRFTEANLISTMKIPYWKLNHLEDSVYRDSLGLSVTF